MEYYRRFGGKRQAEWAGPDLRVGVCGERVAQVRGTAGPVPKNTGPVHAGVRWSRAPAGLGALGRRVGIDRNGSPAQRWRAGR